MIRRGEEGDEEEEGEEEGYGGSAASGGGWGDGASCAGPEGEVDDEIGRVAGVGTGMMRAPPLLEG